MPFAGPSTQGPSITPESEKITDDTSMSATMGNLYPLFCIHSTAASYTSHVFLDHTVSLFVLHGRNINSIQTLLAVNNS